MNYGLMGIYILALMGLLISANKHGKERDNENFWTTIVATLINLTLIWWALGWRFYP